MEASVAVVNTPVTPLLSPGGTTACQEQQGSGFDDETHKDGPISDGNELGPDNRKLAWTERFGTKDARAKSEEERIRMLLNYMEEEKKKNRQENARIAGSTLEDIQEDDEESVKLFLDSRPNSRQVTFRPTSAKSRPLSGRSRPGSARSRCTTDTEHMNGSIQETEIPDPPNTVADENWYVPVRPPSVIENNQAAAITLESFGKYRVSLPSDTQKCIISGMTFLESGDLVLTDRGNEKVKFVDKKCEFISQLSIPEPWDLCSVANEIYVTLGTTVIQHLIVREMVLELGKTFEMNGICYGIANFNNGIAVGLKTSEIHLMNTAGEVKRIIKIPKTDKGKQMCPWHLSVTTKFDIIVTDPNLGTVCCLDTRGDLLFRYNNMSNPRATISDSEGNLFLVGLNKETDLVMQILRKTGDNVICVKSIVSLQDIEFEPSSVCFRKSDRLLVLGGMRHAIKRYKIV